MCESEENSSSSSENSSCDESDYDDVPSDEVFCKEEETCYYKDSNFSDCSTDVTIVITILHQSEYDQSQEEQTCDEVLLNVDEISELLAHDCERYANVFKDDPNFPCNVFSQDEVLSPKFYAESDIKS